MTLQPDDPELHAEEAGLRYITDDRPGVRRHRAGKGFTYIGHDGERISDPDRIAWFKRLAIPPAWTDVWISPIERGHIQATVGARAPPDGRSNSYAASPSRASAR